MDASRKQCRISQLIFDYTPDRLGYNDSMHTPARTYFGIASLIIAVVSILFLAGSFAITMLDISPAQFASLNNVAYLVYCNSTALAMALGVWGLTRKNDFTILSIIALGMVGLPFLFLFWQFVTALIRYN
jgi:hypothetical protein